MSRPKPSNSRLPAPSITGAVEMTSSSTFPAASACRMTPAVHREVVATLVGPRAAHHPVVQALATPSQAGLRAVAGTGDVAVDRRGDGCDDLAHDFLLHRVSRGQTRPGPPTHRISRRAVLCSARSAHRAARGR